MSPPRDRRRGLTYSEINQSKIEEHFWVAKSYDTTQNKRFDLMLRGVYLRIYVIIQQTSLTDRMIHRLNNITCKRVELLLTSSEEAIFWKGSSDFPKYC